MDKVVDDGKTEEVESSFDATGIRGAGRRLTDETTGLTVEAKLQL